jgi:hypothetical protein
VRDAIQFPSGSCNEYENFLFHHFTESDTLHYIQAYLAEPDKSLGSIGEVPADGHRNYKPLDFFTTAKVDLCVLKTFQIVAPVIKSVHSKSEHKIYSAYASRRIVDSNIRRGERSKIVSRSKCIEHLQGTVTAATTADNYILEHAVQRHQICAYIK